MKKRLLFLMFVLAMGWQVRAEMSLVVCSMMEADKITALQKIGKLVYSGDSLLVYDNEGTLVYGDLFENVKHVRYSDERPPILVDDKQGVDALQVVVYPNPTADVLYVDNVEAGVVRLYSAEGRLLQILEVGEDRVMVDMSGYPAGTYLLFCGGEVFSVIKK
jgi:hypothetical protein